jgi:hypothetical protein
MTIICEKNKSYILLLYEYNKQYGQNVRVIYYIIKKYKKHVKYQVLDIYLFISTHD